MKKLIVPIMVSVMVSVMVLLFVGYVSAGVPNPAAVYCNDTMKFDSEKVEGP